MATDTLELGSSLATMQWQVMETHPANSIEDEDMQPLAMLKLGITENGKKDSVLLELDKAQATKIMNAIAVIDSKLVVEE
eukprot:NODE_908_length_559_cov_272.319444_g898_i0.p2 GENE.NODE_908_length_559_cov_272.319444_g898_i0~~NODE_908_length_559_cov_272.319444_g898_i0.p2  ORF type:complete len:80 (-),score=27.11 NODE_908_length_559_cov_272.319444_g898_i0:212-451(-)